MEIEKQHSKLHLIFLLRFFHYHAYTARKHISSLLIDDPIFSVTQCIYITAGCPRCDRKRAAHIPRQGSRHHPASRAVTSWQSSAIACFQALGLEWSRYLPRVVSSQWCSGSHKLMEELISAHFFLILHSYYLHGFKSSTVQVFILQKLTNQIQTSTSSLESHC